MLNSDYSQSFIKFAIDNGVLSFGKFLTKAGRISPYFFNAGKFNSGSALWQLAQFYAQHIISQKIEFDVLFGPAYKGIPLASSVACALYEHNKKEVEFCFNRKEIKTHGEGGVLVGADINNKKVLIIDDVISAGTAIKSSLEILQQNGAIIRGIVIALDRMEKSGTAEDVGSLSAIAHIEQDYNIKITAIANLKQLLDYVSSNTNNAVHSYQDEILQYKNLYCL